MVNRTGRPRSSARIAGPRSSPRGARGGERSFRSPCVVVNAGTVVTIDALDADGVFRGGIILPGLRLMLQAIGERAGAQGAAGPRRHVSGHDAGCARVRRDAGGVRRDRADARAASSCAIRSCSCYLAGGAAHEIAPHLSGPVEVVDNLVLEGVLALAAT